MLLILNRKRISLIILVVVLGVFTFAYQEEKQKIEIQEYVTSIPVSDKVVILDAGHGYPDEGGSLLHQVKNRSNYFFIKNNCRCKSLQFF